MKTRLFLSVIFAFFLVGNTVAQSSAKVSKASVSFNSKTGVSSMPDGYQVAFTVFNMNDQKVQNATRKLNTQDGVKNVVFNGTGETRQLYLTVYNGATGAYMEKLLNTMKFNTLSVDGSNVSSTEFGQKFDALKPSKKESSK